MQLWKHQKLIADYILDWKTILVSADMSTGKTGAAIEALRRLEPARTVILAPTPLILHGWLDEMDKWGYEADTYVLDQPSTPARVKAMPKGDGILLATYTGYWRDDLYKAIRRWAPTVAIYDECHKLKAAGSKQSMRAYRWRGMLEYIIGLTGTMLPNGREDIYGQARAIRPELFGTRYNDFQSRYLIMGGQDNRRIVAYQNVPEYTAKMNQFVLKVEADIELPPTTITTWNVQMKPKTKKAFRELQKDFLTEVDDDLITVDNVLVKSLRLRQMSSGIVTPDDGSEMLIDLSRFEAALDWLDGIRGKKAVIWTNFILENETLYQMATEAGHKVSRMTGPIKEQQAWVDGETDVLIVQLQVGSEGVNIMIGTQYVLYFSPTYSRTHFKQSWKRTERHGATKTVHYTLLKAPGMLDYVIYSALDKKQDIANSVLEALTHEVRL